MILKTKHIVLVHLFIIMLLLSTILAIANTRIYAQTPKREETLIIGNIGAPTLNWNPFAPGGAGGMEWGAWHILYPSVAMQNVLTQDWLLFLIDRIEFNGDEITITIHIRNEARWSDGTPITSRDIVEGYQLSRQVGAGLWGDWCIYNYEVIDDKTLKYYIARTPGEEPPPREEIIMDWLGGPIGCILFIRPVPVHIFKPLIDEMGEGMRVQWRNDDPARQVVAGPYKLYFADATQVIYERIDNWWGKDIFGLPAAKYLMFIYYKDTTVAVSALIRGDIDALGIIGGGAGVFIPNVEELKTRHGIKTWSEVQPYFIPGASFWLYLNLNLPIFQRIEVRRAIAWAIPWEDITEYGLLGLVQQAPVVGFVAEGVYKDYVNREACQKYWGTPDCLLKQDLAKARSILDAAGIVDRDRDGVRELPDGTPLRFTILVSAGAVLENTIASLVADALKDIGIAVAVQAVDYRVWWESFSNGRFDATLCWSAGAYEVGHIRNSYGNALYSPWGNMARWIGYTNDRLNALFEEMMRSLIDPEREKELAYAIQEILFEDLPSIPLFYTPSFWVYNDKYWDGWPNAQRPWWLPSWWGSAPVLFFLTPTGKPIEKPWWLASVEEGGALISMNRYNEYLRRSIYEGKSFRIESGKPTPTPTTPTPTPTPTTPTPTTPTPTPTPTTPTPTTPTPTPTPTTPVVPGATVTVTVTVVQQVERTVYSTITIKEREADWATVAVVWAVLLVVGAIVGWFILTLGKK
ncbi:MAG: ABC transporter substrate-binding protein [Ignisphaera sp.]